MIEHDKVTYPDTYRRSARINGIKLPLGTMTLPELRTALTSAQGRLDEARMDIMVIQDYIDTRFPEQGDLA